MSSAILTSTSLVADPNYSIVVSGIPKNTSKLNLHLLFEPFGTIFDIIPFGNNICNDTEESIIEDKQINEDIITFEKCFITFQKDSTIDSVQNILLHLDKLHFSKELKNIKVEPLIFDQRNIHGITGINTNSTSNGHESHHVHTEKKDDTTSDISNIASTSNNDEDGSDSNRESFEEEYKLFVGMLPKDMIEGDVLKLFKPFGKLKEIYVIRKERMYSKGCAFVKFYSKSSADKAIESLNGSILIGSLKPLVVRYADKSTEKPRTESSSQQQDTGYAHPQVQYQQQLYLQQKQYVIKSTRRNSVNTHNIRTHNRNQQIHPAQGPGSSNEYIHHPPNVPVYGTSGRSYGNSRSFSNHGNTIAFNHVPDVQPYMVPEWYNLNSQNMIYSVTHSSGISHGSINRMNMHSVSAGNPPLMVPVSPHANPYSPNFNLMSDEDGNVNYREKSFPVEKNTGPEGANLFIYHIPREIGDQDLRTLFSKYGTILSAKVYMDKNTLESKGFGFVSYDNVESAQVAIRYMHGYPIGSKKLKVELKKNVR